MKTIKSLLSLAAAVLLFVAVADSNETFGILSLSLLAPVYFWETSESLKNL